MTKVLITGRQGSGKTSLIHTLSDLGYTAFNTDDIQGCTYLQHKTTGQTIDWPDGPVDWASYAWNWQRPVITKLLTQSTNVFVGAIVSNQQDFYADFDKIIVLTVSAETLRDRLSRHEHASHHLPGEIDRIVSNHEAKQNSLLTTVTVPLDANRPLAEIAQDILRICNIPYQPMQ